MAKQLFEDVCWTPLRLVEAKDTDYKGVIGIVEGPFGNTESENRNKRVYTNEFWKGILAREDVQTKMKERALLGEPEHPNSLYPRLDRISHLIPHLELRPEGNEVWGRAELLDTPNGRIMKTLFQAGVKIGISSRGAGALEEKDGKKFVKESDYILGGFDFVSEPSAPNAYPKLKEMLIESLSPVIYEVEKNAEYYEQLLEKFGVNVKMIRDAAEVEVVTEGSTRSSDEQEPEGTSDTTEKLKAKVDGLLLTCKKLTETIEELEGVREDLEEEKRKRKTLVYTNDNLHSQLGRYRLRESELESNLEASKEALDSTRSRLKESTDQLAKDRDEKVRKLTELVDGKRNSLKEVEERLIAADKALKDTRDRLEEKVTKIEDFRKELIETVCEAFNVPKSQLMETLRSGFTPKDVITRAAEISPRLADPSLPFRHLPEEISLVDVRPPQVSDGRRQPSPRFRETLKKTL